MNQKLFWSDRLILIIFSFLFLFFSCNLKAMFSTDHPFSKQCVLFYMGEECKLLGPSSCNLLCQTLNHHVRIASEESSRSILMSSSGYFSRARVLVLNHEYELSDLSIAIKGEEDLNAISEDMITILCDLKENKVKIRLHVEAYPEKEASVYHEQSEESASLQVSTSFFGKTQWGDVELVNGLNVIRLSECELNLIKSKVIVGNNNFDLMGEANILSQMHELPSVAIAIPASAVKNDTPFIYKLEESNPPLSVMLEGSESLNLSGFWNEQCVCSVVGGEKKFLVTPVQWPDTVENILDCSFKKLWHCIHRFDRSDLPPLSCVVFPADMDKTQVSRSLSSSRKIKKLLLGEASKNTKVRDHSSQDIDMGRGEALVNLPMLSRTYTFRSHGNEVVEDGKYFIKVVINDVNVQLQEKENDHIRNCILPVLNMSLEKPPESVLSRQRNGKELLYLANPHSGEVFNISSYMKNQHIDLVRIEKEGLCFLSFNCPQDIFRYRLKIKQGRIQKFNAAIISSEVVGNPVEQRKAVVQMLRDQSFPPVSWYPLTFLCSQEISGDMVTYLNKEIFPRLVMTSPFENYKLDLQQSSEMDCKIGRSSGSMEVNIEGNCYRVSVHACYRKVIVSPQNGKRELSRLMLKKLQLEAEKSGACALPANIVLSLDFTIKPVSCASGLIQYTVTGGRVIVSGDCEKLAVLLPNIKPDYDKGSLRRRSRNSSVTMGSFVRSTAVSTEELLALDCNPNELVSYVQEALGQRNANSKPVSSLDDRNCFAFESSIPAFVKGFNYRRCYIHILAMNMLFSRKQRDIPLCNLVPSWIDKEYLVRALDLTSIEGCPDEVILSRIKKSSDNFSYCINFFESLLDSSDLSVETDYFDKLFSMASEMTDQNRNIKTDQYGEILNYILSVYLKQESLDLKKIISTFNPACLKCVKSVDEVQTVVSGIAKKIGVSTDLIRSLKAVSTTGSSKNWSEINQADQYIMRLLSSSLKQGSSVQLSPDEACARLVPFCSRFLARHSSPLQWLCEVTFDLELKAADCRESIQTEPPEIVVNDIDDIDDFLTSSNSANGDFSMRMLGPSIGLHTAYADNALGSHQRIVSEPLRTNVVSDHEPSFCRSQSTTETHLVSRLFTTSLSGGLRSSSSSSPSSGSSRNMSRLNILVDGVRNSRLGSMLFSGSSSSRHSNLVRVSKMLGGSLGSNQMFSTDLLHSTVTPDSRSLNRGIYVEDLTSGDWGSGDSFQRATSLNESYRLAIDANGDDLYRYLEGMSPEDIADLFRCITSVEQNKNYMDALNPEGCEGDVYSFTVSYIQNHDLGAFVSTCYRTLERGQFKQYIGIAMGAFNQRTGGAETKRVSGLKKRHDPLSTLCGQDRDVFQ